MLKKWNHNEIDILKRLYPDNKNIDISQVLGRSQKSIESKAQKLKLYKNSVFKAKLISHLKRGSSTL